MHGSQLKGNEMQKYDLSCIKQHPYIAAYDGELLGPLAEAPQIEADSKTADSVIYENGGAEEVARTLIRNTARITLKTKNIGTALDLISKFSNGNDVISADQRKPLSFTPITEDENEKVLTFHCAALMPELVYLPGLGKDHVATIVFTAYPDENGKLFTFA